MNTNMLSILIIRMNLIFRVSFTFFTNNNLLDNIMNPVRKELKEYWEEQWTTKVRAVRGSEPLILTNSILETKRMKLIKDNMLEQIMSWFRHQSSKIPDLFQKSSKFAAQEVLLTVMRLRKIQKRKMTILITIKSPHS